MCGCLTSEGARESGAVAGGPEAGGIAARAPNGSFVINLTLCEPGPPALL